MMILLESLYLVPYQAVHQMIGGPIQTELLIQMPLQEWNTIRQPILMKKPIH